MLYSVLFASIYTGFIQQSTNVLLWLNLEQSGKKRLSPFNGHFSKWTWVSQNQNVSTLDFIGAKDAGCGSVNWSFTMCKAPVVNCHHQQTNTQLFCRLNALPVD